MQGYNATMDQNLRGHKITIRPKKKSVTKKSHVKRAPWKLTFAVIKTYFSNLATS